MSLIQCVVVATTGNVVRHLISQSDQIAPLIKATWIEHVYDPWTTFEKILTQLGITKEEVSGLAFYIDEEGRSNNRLRHAWNKDIFGDLYIEGVTDGGESISIPDEVVVKLIKKQ